MAKEAYRVYNFIADNITGLPFGPLVFQPGLSPSDGPIAGIEYTIAAGCTLMVRHGQDGDLYQVFDGEVRNHISLAPSGCLEGETSGFCFVGTGPIGGAAIVLRVTYGNYFGGGAEAVKP